MGQKTNSQTKTETRSPSKEKTKSKRYATKFGQHYSIIMVPTVTEVINGIPMTKPGKILEFKNGIYETASPEEQKFLETSGYLGVDYIEVTKEVDSALQVQSLAEKEAELKTREEALNKKEMENKGQSEGAEMGSVDKNSEKNKKKQPKF